MNPFYIVLWSIGCSYILKTSGLIPCQQSSMASYDSGVENSVPSIFLGLLTPKVLIGSFIHEIMGLGRQCVLSINI